MMWVTGLLWRILGGGCNTIARLVFKDASSCCVEMGQVREQAGRPLERRYRSPGSTVVMVLGQSEGSDDGQRGGLGSYFEGSQSSLLTAWGAQRHQG